MEAKGNEGTVSLLEGAVLLEFTKFTSPQVKKEASPRRIRFAEITAIELNKGGGIKQNYLRFRRSEDTGVPDPKQEKDPNAMCFITDKDGRSLGHLAASVAAETGIAVSGSLAHLAVLPDSPQEELDASGVRPDIAAAVAKMGWKLGGRREIRKLNEHLQNGETVDRILQGTYEGDQGILAVTDQRVVFLFHGLMRQRVEDFAYERISSVQSKHGLVLGSIVIYASSNKAEIGDIQKPEVNPLADIIRQRLGQSRHVEAAVPQPQASVGTSDPIEQIKKLGELRGAGLLSDEEFEAKKADLLKRIR